MLAFMSPTRVLHQVLPTAGELNRHLHWLRSSTLPSCSGGCRWTADLVTPKSVWLPGLFNPQSFLTAVMQTTARRNEWPLDKTVIVTEVTKRQPEQLEAASKEGAYIHGCARNTAQTWA